ncbi:MAG: HAMP domain-containing protein [Candidatus Rokubacteria bacterium]|nr:HAMP domain-containing protein [Candidatus Rokubacteria bacterium]
MKMININKLFPRLSIRAKLVVAFCLFGVVPVAVVGGYGAAHSFRLLNDVIHDRLRDGVLMKAEEIQRFLDEVQGNGLFLSRLPTLQALIDLPPRAREERGRLVFRLGQEFLSFSRSHPAYYQIRYIDERGREIVRADFDEKSHGLVPPDRLQDKQDRYYFREAMTTPPGTIYVSPMDLNIERGAVEVPHKPVVRYAMALQTGRGEPRGIIILNLYASHILRRVLALGQEMGDVSLASSAGFYLSRSEWIRADRDSFGSSNPPFPSWLASYSERLRYGQDFSGLRREQQLSKDFTPDLSATILGGHAGTVVEPGLRGRIVAFVPIFPRRDRQGEFWVLTHAYRKTEVLSSIRSLQVLILVLGGGVLVVALVLGVAAARQFTRPITELIRGAEAVAQGEFDRPIRVETNDEIEDLADQFNRMAGHLKEHEQGLLDARARAERKTREAQALSRIGTEISRLLSLTQVLQLVVEKARELLQGDVAILCLEEPGVGLRVGAASGPPEALSLRPGEPLDAIACVKVGFPEALCPVAHGVRLPTHVAVPLKSGERVVGNLCVGYWVARPVSQDELEFLDGLANQAAIAIENARLHRQVRDLAALEERERIGQVLHVGVIQSIYAAGLGLEECVRLAEEDPREVAPKLEAAIDSLNTVIRDVRNYIVGLQPEELRERGLSRSLADLARGLALNALLHSELEVEPGVDESLTPEQNGHLFHICREALTNVVKHARASRVALTMERGSGILFLTVKDDGVGFEPEQHDGGGRGLRNMGERARRLGGSLSIESAPGQGTRITLEVPQENA